MTYEELLKEVRTHLPVLPPERCQLVPSRAHETDAGWVPEPGSRVWRYVQEHHGGDFAAYERAVNVIYSHSK